MRSAADPRQSDPRQSDSRSKRARPTAATFASSGAVLQQMAAATAMVAVATAAAVTPPRSRLMAAALPLPVLQSAPGGSQAMCRRQTHSLLAATAAYPLLQAM